MNNEEDNRKEFNPLKEKVSSYDGIRRFFEKRKFIMTEEEYVFVMTVLNNMETKYSDINYKSELLKEEGNKLFKDNNLEAAFEKYNETLSIDPCNVNALINRSIILQKQNQIKSAMKDCLNGLEIEPSNLKLYKRLAYLNQETNPELSLKYVKKGLLIDESDKTLNDMLNLSKDSNKSPDILNNSDFTGSIDDLLKDINTEDLSKMFGSVINKFKK
ncbi:DNJC7 [Hepatospora eriocheir]|uniref:DNJC7 n=1 Tax=Hepatospora eriocheir TaxID=1081669 RepID=A0A1X0Q819_9MICR|nr:DNJC7 [Hepatospora eriocheir]